MSDPAPGHPRVVIAHEWLTVVGGSDRTAQIMVQALPEARLVTAVADPRTVAELFPETEVETLWTDRLPSARRRWRAYSPAIVLAWTTFRPRGADVLVSSSHFASRAAASGFSGTHLCYCYTPMRVAWRPDLELARLRPALRPVAAGILPAVRAWDRRTAAGVTAFAGISSAVVDRIRNAYGRDARCVFPPVDVPRFLASPRHPSPPGYFLTLGRLIPYKRFDLAIQACTAAGHPLVVAGTGPDEARLRALAGPTVRFVGRVDDGEYLDLLAGATALLFPGEEDFGIVPVEAQAAGCPVVALGRGGALDTVRPGTTGILFAEPSVESLQEGIDALLGRSWDEAALRGWASQFSDDRFVREFRAFVTDNS